MDGQPELYAENSWREEMTGEKGILIYPRELEVVGGDDDSCWLWHSLILESQGQLGVEVPKLMGTKHVEVHGRWKISDLTPGLKYQVLYMIMVEDPLEGWESCPLKLRVTLPDGSSQTQQVDLCKLPKGQLIMTVAGFFDSVGDGEVIFSVIETSDVVKKGLVIKDAVIRPLPPMSLLLMNQK
ncbi:uncharacterized protein A4U43_C04F13350 [Asparagus officinalis]|uniref:Uncharacterized protein n=1 Tax=Asparagus officinalis TaxID=4686 RepID=A0A5P1F121_ASPOF|nr:protein PHLOEM PROTEIN 2-LIKE A1-like [Asparagus officinalis]ONK71882.1 uncharacterized protein A4U43_C04F13350 [Asparagus officinalis]